MKRRKRDRTIGGAHNSKYNDNWYALYISIVTEKSAEESLAAMDIPSIVRSEVKKKVGGDANTRIE